MKRCKRWSVPIIAAVLAACSHSPSAPETTDATPEAAPSPESGEALVYILRDEQFAAGHMLAVELADQGETALPAGSSHRWRVEPGHYALRSEGPASEALELDVGGGDRAFVRASVQVTDAGVGARFTQLPEERGRQALKRTRLLADDP